MRLRHVAHAVLSAAFCGSVVAQEAVKGCTPVSAYTHRASLEEGTFRFTVSPDLRSRAGFSPAIALSLSVPAGEAPAEFSGQALLRTSTGEYRLSPARAEYWVMGAAPRTAVPLSLPAQFAPRSQSASTLYYIFYRLPAAVAAEFTLALEPLSYQGVKVTVEPLLFQRSSQPPGLTLCARNG